MKKQTKWNTVMGSMVLAIVISFAVAGFANSADREIKNGTIRIDKESETDFPSMAKISINKAIRKAKDPVQGSILKAELENENGFLVYDVEVVSSDGVTTEVKVDAGSNEVLAVERDQADE